MSETKPEKKRRVLSLRCKEETVDIEQLDGKIATFTVREPTGFARDGFLNKHRGRLKVDAKGQPVGVADFTGFQVELLEICLYDDKGVLVPAIDIAEWPATTQHELFKIAQEISGFGVEAESEPKKL